MMMKIKAAGYNSDSLTVENFVSLDSSAEALLSDLGRKISSVTCNNNETIYFLSQRMSMAIQFLYGPL